MTIHRLYVFVHDKHEFLKLVSQFLQYAQHQQCTFYPDIPAFPRERAYNAVWEWYRGLLKPEEAPIVDFPFNNYGDGVTAIASLSASIEAVKAEAHVVSGSRHIEPMEAVLRSSWFGYRGYTLPNEIGRLIAESIVASIEEDLRWYKQQHQPWYKAMLREMVLTGAYENEFGEGSPEFEIQDIVLTAQLIHPLYVRVRASLQEVLNVHI